MVTMKKPVYDLESQQNDVDSKIIVAFEKMAEVVRVLLWNQGKMLRLSPIQLQLLIFIKYHTQEKCKVGYLAKEFNLTKPTVSDSIRILLQKKLVTKTVDNKDSRSYSLRLTSEGHELTSKVEHYTEDLQQPLLELSLEKKSALLEGMMELLYGLQKGEVIEKQRMCFNCEHYEGDRKERHYCNFLEKKLSGETIRIDCIEFKTAS